MKIDLHNFFKYYDDKLPKHRAAIDDLERLLSQKAPELLDDTSNWVRIYRSKQEAETARVLDVPFFPQTDNYALPDATCNSSSCAMCLEYFKPGTLKGPRGDDEYLRKVLSIGKSTDQGVQTTVLKGYGINSVFRTNLNFSDLDIQLASGRPIVLGILHRGPVSNPTRNSGHMIVCIGKTTDGNYVFHDPYGSLNNGYTGPAEQGKNIVYKKSELEKRWTADGPSTGWGRIFDAKKS